MVSRLIAGALLVAWSMAGCGRVGFADINQDARGARADDAGGADGPGPALDALTGVNVVFTTSSVHAPRDLGGLPGADEICTARAGEAGLPGTYVAWLSTAGTSAPSRLAGARGWVRPDGRPVFDTVAELSTGILWYPLDRDEQGRAVRTTSSAGVLVATGTNMDGSYSGEDCAGYTSTGVGSVEGGRADVGTRNWTQGFGIGCDQPIRLYCLGIDHATPVSLSSGTARGAFLLSTASFSHNTGVAGADAACQGEATSSGLSGTYRALLASTGSSPISRFQTGGAPWARVDGVLLAESAEAFAVGQFLAPLEVTAGGMRPLPGMFATTGAASPSTAGDDTTTCQAWTRASSTTTRAIASTNSVEVFSTQTTNCVNPSQLYCLEQ